MSDFLLDLSFNTLDQIHEDSNILKVTVKDLTSTEINNHVNNSITRLSQLETLVKILFSSASDEIIHDLTIDPCKKTFQIITMKINSEKTIDTILNKANHIFIKSDKHSFEKKHSTAISKGDLATGNFKTKRWYPCVFNNCDSYYVNRKEVWNHMAFDHKDLSIVFKFELKRCQIKERYYLRGLNPVTQQIITGITNMGIMDVKQKTEIVFAYTNVYHLGLHTIFQPSIVFNFQTNSKHVLLHFL